MFRRMTIALLLLAGFTSTAQAEAPKTHKPSQKWALLIGVNDYAYINKLNFCGTDMEALRAQLAESGFAEKQIRLLTDSAKDKKYLPNKTNIEAQIDLVTKLVDQGDVLVLAFSGHGISLDGKSYICPEDAKLDDYKTTMVSVDSVYERLKKCKAALKIVLVDACRDDPTPGGKKGLKDLADDNRKFARPLEKVPEGIVLLNSCSPGESSMEDKKLSHGVFTHFLLKGLQGAADENGDGIVTLAELAAYTGSETKNYVSDRWAYLQRPYLKGDLSTDALRFDFGRVERMAINSFGQKFAYIPAGEFLMGNDESVDEVLKAFPYAERNYLVRSRKQHRVQITKPFFLGVYPVTKADFARFVSQEDYKTDAEKDGKGGTGFPKDDFSARQLPSFNWRNTGFQQGDDHPVVNVSWNDAIEYAKWLSKRDGRTYRLPTEAEWEYACRARQQTRFSFGNNPLDLANYANTANAPDGYVYTSPVGKFKSNSFGLYDMHGNVAQWCQDWFGEDYYDDSPVADPQGPNNGTDRVGRGGTYCADAVYCRSAYRRYDPPSAAYADLGFRLLLVP